MSLLAEMNQKALNLGLPVSVPCSLILPTAAA